MCLLVVCNFDNKLSYNTLQGDFLKLKNPSFPTVNLSSLTIRLRVRPLCQIGKEPHQGKHLI